MILTVHLLTGAAIASRIKFAPMALVLAFLGHYLLDFIPHQEYSIKNIKERQWRNSFLDFLKIGVDICFGILLIFIFSKNEPMIYAGALSAILTDSFTFLGLIFPNRILKIHDNFHQKIHPAPSKRGGVPLFVGIFSQVLVFSLAIFFLL